MKKSKILLIFGLIYFARIIPLFATEAYISGGQVFFTGYCASCTITAPQDFEINLSTTLLVTIDGKVELKFDNYSDWIDCQTKSGLKRKYRKLQAIIDSHGVLPASLTSELKERSGWLRSYYLSLP